MYKKNDGLLVVIKGLKICGLVKYKTTTIRITLAREN